MKRFHRAERRFGVTVGAVALAFGSWWLYRGKFPQMVPIALACGTLLVMLGLLAPAALRWPNRVWLRLGEALGYLMTRVILAVVFYGVVTPIGLLRRAVGGDPLRRRSGPSDSYWLPYPERHHDPKHFEKMY